MNPMDFLEQDELLRFFRRNKTELSLMENPHAFLSQLRDHDLIPEDRYKKVSKMKNNENRKKALYDILDWVERKKPQHIHLFWTCVFKETILSTYPTLQSLRKSLLDGSFHFDIEMPETVENEARDKKKKKMLSEDEEEQEKSVKKKRKTRSKSMCEDDQEEPGPSSKSTPGQKKKSKIHFSSPLKKGEKNDIWNWPLYKTHLPVTCGGREGMLDRDKLEKGEKCIAAEKQWFTPGEFEKFAGKGTSKNWKMSIRCRNTPLGKLIKEGHLKLGRYKGGNKKVKKSLFPADSTEESEEEDEDEDSNLKDQEGQALSSRIESLTASVSDEEEDTEEQTEQQPGTSHDRSRMVFKVTCGDAAGTLYKKRFASGKKGKSIRTETSWMTPVEFIEKSSSSCVSWRKDIQWEGKPLNVLIEEKTLRIHSLLCTCRMCGSDPDDLENQKNDDECCICKSQEEEELVVCDLCPRAFHQKCHLPHVEDALLGDSGPWLCTFCIFKTNQTCFYPDELEREAVMSRKISSHLLQCQYILLCLCSADEEQIFATNPSLYVENYSNFIKTPMWLGNIADKLQRTLYQTVGEFVADVQLIFTNCATFNRKKAEFLAMGERLKQLFDEEFKKAFNIRE